MATDRPVWLRIYKCHWFTITIDDDDGYGYRWLGGKCCPSQYANKIAEWRMSRDDVEEFYKACAVLQDKEAQETLRAHNGD